MGNELKKSNEYYKKALDIFPVGTQTLSKAPRVYSRGSYPLFLERGDGSHVWDVDGNEYIDWVGALCPIILGYNYKNTNNAIRKQLSKGIIFSLPHPLEIEVAELLQEIIPCCEMVRFGKSGSDACSGAVKIARAYTGREKIASQGYHGWHEWYNVIHQMNKGVPQILKDYIFEFKYNNIETLEKIFEEHPDEIAAVIMEPIMLEEPSDNFLEKVLEITHDNRALLIFDEIITGFRFALGGIQELYNITPDLACFGKAMGNGMPISAIVGKRDIMQTADDLFISFTHGGETLSLAAAKATINELRNTDAIDHIWKIGKMLSEGYNEIVKEFGLEKHTYSKGLPPHNVILFDDHNNVNHLEVKTLFFQETAKRGVLFGVGQNPSYSHTEEDVKFSLDVAREALTIIRKAIDNGDVKSYLEGPVVAEILREYN